MRDAPEAFSIQIPTSPLPMNVKRKWARAKNETEINQNEDKSSLEERLERAEQRREV